MAERDFTFAGNRVWLDVGDLLWWEHTHPTGIQRVMASVSRELLRPEASGVPIRFCRMLDGVGFIEVPRETLRQCVDRLLGDESVPSRDPDLKNISRPQGPETMPLRRNLNQAKQKLRTVLRHIYGPLSRAAEPQPHESPTTITARLRRMVRRFEFWCLRKWLGADRLFRPNDILLNVGSTWWQPAYPAVLAAIRRKKKLTYIALVYDLLPWRLPQCFPDSMPPRFIEWALATFRSADKLLTISNASRRDVIAFTKEFNLPDKPITVIRLGRERIANVDPALPAALNRAAPGFVLSVGTVEARKNHMLLVRTWARLMQRHDPTLVPQLVWVGRKGWMIDPLLAELAENNFLDGKLVWLGQTDGVKEATLHGLYRACLFTMFPSLYEGWGLPVSESLAHGKLCIASNASSLPEAGGDLADYHAPEDVDRCLALVERAIFDPAYRSAREERIRREYEMPSWAACAQGIIAACMVGERSESTHQGR